MDSKLYLLKLRKYGEMENPNQTHYLLDLNEHMKIGQKKKSLRNDIQHDTFSSYSDKYRNEV